MTDRPRLIEHAFPLKQASLDSVHEKNVRHGHISTLHIWPARRPLAACRAALIATLLPDPGTPEERRKLCERIGGRVVKTTERKKMPGGRVVERLKEETEGGILHWLGSEPNSGGRKKREEYRRKAKFYQEELDWFRQQIRDSFGGRSPRVLDPFAGGGAIPLEAMRLGCEVTAVDVNPVAWFILRCTLEYAQKHTATRRPLPEFVLEDEDFMEAFYKEHPHVTGNTTRTTNRVQRFGNGLFGGDVSDSVASPEADLAWHLRAWGRWVLQRARRELATLYPTYADFEPLTAGKAYERVSMRLVPPRDEGTPNVEALNVEFSEDYLTDKRNPRWVAKPTVGYLWARTVTCKNCRAAIPLLKTRWLCKKANKRVLLTMDPNVEKTGVAFGVTTNVPSKGGNAAQRREHDKVIGLGTLTQSGAKCPCCPAIMTLSDIQVAAQAHEWGTALTAVVVDGLSGKEYRPPTDYEVQASASQRQHPFLAADPLCEPIDPIRPSPNARGLSGLTRYGITTFGDVFSARQQAVLATLCECISAVRQELSQDDWGESVADLLAVTIDHISNRNSTLCHWDMGRETISSTFQRYALRVNWDFAESNPAADGSGSLAGALEWIALAISNALKATQNCGQPEIVLGSATRFRTQPAAAVDVVLTDPPYYDAIPYADLSDFFYVWLRRILRNRYPNAFSTALTEKSEELVQHAARANGHNADAKQRYENGMAESFSAMRDSLTDDGYLVVVFAHKQPDAWETLASSIVRSGFSVFASWPIETEMPNKAAGGARLASSVWLVCKKRPVTARPGWDNHVLEEMRAKISSRLRDFWDAGIRGPDFVWAATGPALEAYSKHPVVKKANEAGKTLEVGEFLAHVRRMVVDFVVGQVLMGDGGDLAAADRMDAPTAYYLLHRHYFGLQEAPSGACILYATACGMSDSDLESVWEIVVRTGGDDSEDDESGEDTEVDAEIDPDAAADSGSKVKLRTWAQRTDKNIGYEAPGGQPVPLIDRIHRLMHLWRAGDLQKVDEYLDEFGLRRQELFKRLLQSLIELSRKDGQAQELQTLESLSSHVRAKGSTPKSRQEILVLAEEE